MAVNEDILAEEDLCALADARHKRVLVKWLDDNRIPYVLARSGWPRVHRKALERAMGVREKAEKVGSVEFNFDSVK